jgi:hypothetical protein
MQVRKDIKALNKAMHATCRAIIRRRKKEGKGPFDPDVARECVLAARELEWEFYDKLGRGGV